MFLRLSAMEYWDLIAVAFEIPEEEKNRQLMKLMTLFDMSENQTSLISSFSHGMRQKTFIIGALLSNPEIWVLDEPMTGLDPQASYDLKELMRQHASKGNTVLFSTHVLEVAQQLCDHIAILKNGEILYDGTVEQLQAENEEQSLETIYLKMAGRTPTEKQIHNEIDPSSPERRE